MKRTRQKQLAAHLRQIAERLDAGEVDAFMYTDGLMLDRIRVITAAFSVGEGRVHLSYALEGETCQSNNE